MVRQQQEKRREKRQEQRPIHEEAQATLKRLEEKDPGLRRLLGKAHAYAVFPNVGRASLVVGGSHGQGAVYERGKPAGFATFTQTTGGVQLGGKTFTEILVFENPQAFDRFKQNRVHFAANASTALLNGGASATKGPEKGMKALAYSKGGMLLELAIGGQKFKFRTSDPSRQQTNGKKQDRGIAGQAKRGASQLGRAGQQSADLGREGQESWSSGLSWMAGRGLQLTAALAAAALERLKPEDIQLMIKALANALRKYADQQDDQDEEQSQEERQPQEGQAAGSRKRRGQPEDRRQQDVGMEEEEDEEGEDFEHDDQEDEADDYQEEYASGEEEDEDEDEEDDEQEQDDQELRAEDEDEDEEEDDDEEYEEDEAEDDVRGEDEYDEQEAYGEDDIDFGDEDEDREDQDVAAEADDEEEGDEADEEPRRRSRRNSRRAARKVGSGRRR